MTNLQGLVLSRNQLTGEIPEDLGNLSKLQRVFLPGNQLTGCIPVGLRGVADDRADNDPDNDLGRLGLPFCDDDMSGPTPSKPVEGFVSVSAGGGPHLWSEDRRLG